MQVHCKHVVVSLLTNVQFADDSEQLLHRVIRKNNGCGQNQLHRVCLGDVWRQHQSPQKFDGIVANSKDVGQVEVASQALMSGFSTID